jgi:WD40 repeat protein
MPTAHKPVLESLEPEPPPELHPSFMSVLVVEPQIINAGDEAKLTFRLQNSGDDNLHHVTVRRGRTLLDEPFDMTIGQERHFTFTTTHKTEGKKTVKVTATGIASNGESVRSEASAIVQVRPLPTSKPAPKPKPPIKLQVRGDIKALARAGDPERLLRCPICKVEVNARNLLQHFDRNHGLEPMPVVAPLKLGKVPEPQQPKPVAATLIKPQAIFTTVHILEGHMEAVNSVAFSPDGKTLASGAGSGLLWSNDNTVRLWRVSDGKLLNTLEGHTNWVRSVAFSPDGKTLASGSDDNTVRLWRVSDGKLRRTLEGLEGHTNNVMSVAFSPDGKTLASGSVDNTVRLWRVSDRKLRRTLEGHTDWVNSVAFSPDGTRLASGSDDNTVRLWG